MKSVKDMSYQFLFKRFLKTLKNILPDDIGYLFDEFNDPSLYEPYLQELFFALFKNLDIPPAEIRFCFGYSAEANKILYIVQVVNVHDRKWWDVEFPLGIFLKNIFDDTTRSRVIDAAREGIIVMRNYNKATDQVMIPLGNGEHKVFALPE